MTPVVAIVGRPNVGKSSLLNWLAGRRISIVDPTAGVTRDRISTPVTINDLTVELTDTGGMGIEDRDELTADVESQIAVAIQAASLVVFVVDGREGLTPLDELVATRLRAVDKPIILVVNKCDTEELGYAHGIFYSLGFEPVIEASVEQNRHRNELLKAIHDNLGDAPSTEQQETDLKIAVVGKRNAGKSTFINALAGEERVIVSEVPGTTRDSVDVRIERDGKVVIAIDTAGVRARKSLQDDIEFYSLARAERSIRRADVVLHLFDAEVPVSRVDMKLTEYVIEQNKPAVFVMNKFDLVKERADSQDFADYLAKCFPMLDYVPVAMLTAKEGRNVNGLLNLARTLAKQARQRVGTGEINRVLRDAMLRNPPHNQGGRQPKVFFATQVAAEPPTIVVFANDPELFDEPYRRYLLKAFRATLPFQEVPIKLVFRPRSNRMGAEDGPPVRESLTSSSEPKGPPMRKGKPKKKPGTWKI